MSDPGIQIPYVGDRERFVVETYDLDHNIADPTTLEFIFESETGVISRFSYDPDDENPTVFRRATGVYYTLFTYAESGIYTWGVKLTGNMQKTAKETVNVLAQTW